MEKEKVKQFLKENFWIILILFFGFIIRIYYLILTKNQAEWWDSGEYASYALHWAFGLPLESINPQRPPLFPLLEAILFKLGFNEITFKFILELIPSTLIILVSYLIVKEMYNKKLALIVALFTSVFWLLIFNTVRLHADVLLILFSYLAVYYFWKGYIKKEKNYYIWLIGVFIALAFMTKLIAGLFGIIFLVYILIIDKFKFLKNKHLWISLILMFLLLLPYFIWQINEFGKPTAFLAGSHVTSDPGGITSYKPVGWYILKHIPWMLNTTLLILMFIGILTLYTLFLSLDLVIKNKNKESYNDLFIFIWILITLIYFIFLERDAEDRWLLPIMLPLLVIAGKGLIFVYDSIKKYEKKVAISVFIILILVSFYFQIDRASEIINAKKDSYKEVKEASLWIKENSKENDVIFSKSVTQMTYYSRRYVTGFGGNETEFKEKIKQYKPKYIVFSIFEPHGTTFEYTTKFSNSIVPVQAYFADNEKTKAVLIIYEFKNYDL